MCRGNEFCKQEVEIPKLSTSLSKENLNTNLNKNVVVYQTKKLILQITSLCDYIETWKYYRMIRGKTQPAHMLTVLSVLVMGKLLQNDANNDMRHLTTSLNMMKLIYLGCFAAHFGAQIWMTFVSGLSLYFTLPRHTFGSVQQILFPKYFSINSALSFITLCTFVKCHTSSDSRVQLIFLVLCFFIEFMIRLHLTPVLVQLMVSKNSIEKGAGVGTEVGKYLPGHLAACPEYMLIHANFRKVHMAIAIGNMMSMACTFAHLHYLSSKMCI